MTGTGTISFQNIPVAAPSGVNLAGARQGLLYNAGYIELGNPDLFDTSTNITDERYIVLGAPSGGLWMLSDGNTGWRGDQTTFTVINNGMEWQWLLKGGTENIIRAVTPGRNAGIEFYNIGAPTGPMAFMGYEWGTNGGLRFRTESGFPSNTIGFNTAGVNVVWGASDVTISATGVTNIGGDNGLNLITGGVNKLIFSSVLGRFMVPMAIGSTPATSAAWMKLSPSALTRAHIILEPGLSPSAPTDGMIWYDGTDLYMNVGGTVKTFQLI